VILKENMLLPTDTLHIKFKHNDYYAKNIDDRDGFKIAQDPNGNEVLYLMMLV
jgi:hypothetical protein